MIPHDWVQVASSSPESPSGTQLSAVPLGDAHGGHSVQVVTARFLHCIFPL